MSPKQFTFWKFGVIYLCLSWRIIPTVAKTDIVLTQLQTFVYDEEFVEKLDLRLVPYNGRNVINGSFAFTRSMGVLNSRIVLEFEKPDKTRMQVLDLKFEACKVLTGNLDKQKLMKLLKDGLAKQPNFPQKCPLEGNKVYELFMFDLEAPQFPLPNLKFIFSSTLYAPDNVHKYYEVRVKGATKRKP